MMAERRGLRLSEKTTIVLSGATLFALVAGSFTIGGKYENWDNWRMSVMQFIRDQRNDTAQIQSTLQEIKSQIAIQKADAQ